MQGQFHEINLPSLLRLIEAGQRTGELWIDARGLSPWQQPPTRLLRQEQSCTEKTWLLTFVQGQLVHGSRTGDRANRLKDSLQRLAVEFPDPDFIFQHSTEQHSPEYEILWLLLEQRQIRPDQGCAVIRQLCEETLFELANLRRGSFCFKPGTALCPYFTTLPVGALLHRLEQRLHQWQQLYPVIDSPSQCPLLLNPEAVQARLPNQAFAALDRWADGKTSLFKLARRLNRHTVSVARAIYPYIQAKFIRLQTPEHPAQTSALPALTNASLNAAASLSSPPFANAVQPNPLEQPQPQTASTIVCIDSQPQDLAQLEAAIAPSGHLIKTFTNPLEALPALFSLSPSLVIAALDMPGVNGGELCSMWRQVPQFRQVPIILSTESQDFMHRTEAQIAGATDYFAKPLDGDEVLMLLEKYIRPVPTPRPVFSEVWRSDALQSKLGHDNGEAKFTSTN